jgi:[protein-PII] uridylyltransferase
MPGYLTRAGAALWSLLRPPAAARPSESSAAERVGENLVIAAGHLTFSDPARAASDPASWFEAFSVAAARGASVSRDALALIKNQLGTRGGETLLPPERMRDWLLTFLRPRRGLSKGLADLDSCGLLGRVLGDGSPAGSRRVALGAVEALEQLLGEESLSAERFGPMLREVNRPELLVLALLLREGDVKNDVEGVARRSKAFMERLALPADDQHLVDFLIRRQSQFAQTAFRQDTGDPDVIRTFAGIVTSVEQLKMLCLMTVVDRGTGTVVLTPWKAELLWRLFVDTYNYLTMTYADEIIDKGETVLAALVAKRPPTISEAELTKFLEGLPRRYLTLFDADSIYAHVELCRGLTTDDVHFSLKHKATASELTVITHDKPFLFSNICGALSYLNVDILRGHALTSLTSVVIDVFEFTPHPDLTEASFSPLLSDVVSGRVDVTALLREKERTLRPPGRQPVAPVIYFDNDSSQRYTVLELMADDSLGLLHRVSRAISGYGCSVELVLISTEGSRAIDVFHLRRGDGKLSDPDQLALTEALEYALQPPPLGAAAAHP